MSLRRRQTLEAMLGHTADDKGEVLRGLPFFVHTGRAVFGCPNIPGCKSGGDNEGTRQMKRDICYTQSELLYISIYR